MAGTVSGGKLAAKKNLERDPDFYKKIGSRGGKNSSNGGFAKRKECNCSLVTGTHTVPVCAGKKGGMVKGASYKKKLDTPEQEFKLPEIKPKKRFAVWGR